MSAPEVNFQCAQPEHLPAVIDLLEHEDMRDPRRDTIPRLEKVIGSRPDAIVVGINKDGEVVASAYIGDILPIVSGVVVRPDHQNRGIGEGIMHTTGQVAASMGHKYTEVIVSKKMKPYYERLGFYATDTCILMERPIPPSDESLALLPSRQPQRQGTRKFDYKNQYRPDVYHAAFSTLLQTCIERPTMSYVQEYPSIARLYTQEETDWYATDSIIEGKMLQVHDPELRKKGIYGWAAFQERGVDVLKLLNNEADIEPTVQTPFEGQVDQGVHYVRAHNSTNDSIKLSSIISSSTVRDIAYGDPPKFDGERGKYWKEECEMREVYKLPDTPTRLNFLVATVQTLKRNEFETLDSQA